jgi:hypothetical protein
MATSLLRFSHENNRQAKKTPQVTSPTVTHVTPTSIRKDDHTDYEMMVTWSEPLPTSQAELSMQAKQDDLAPTCVVCGAEVEHYSPEGVAYCEQHLPREETPSEVSMTYE